MKTADIVIIGGSAAGLTAAITARLHWPEKTALLIRKEQKVPIPCGIPYIFGTVGSPEKNLIPDTALEKNGIELLVSDARAIDRERKVVVTADGEVQYDKLIIATGSEPIILPIDGIDLPGVFVIRKDVPYLTEMQKWIEKSKDVVVIGGGFIGVEFADEINKPNGKRVSILEMMKHCLSLAYDHEFCEKMEELVRARGINIQTEAKVQAIKGDGKVEKVVLSDGSELKADVVIVGIGARPNVALAKDAGLEISSRTGAICVDRTMRTSDENIFSCGDCADKVSFFGGVSSTLRLASIATSEARIAGANVFGVKRENIGTIGVWSTAVGDLALGGAGLTEGMAKARGYDAIATSVEGPNRHPGTMPNAVNSKVKLLFDRNTGTILGGQVAGDASAGEVINTISACIQSKMTAEQIAVFQTGTHPALTASPIVYPLVSAAEMAIAQMSKSG